MIYDNVIKAARLNATRNELVNGTLELLSAADDVLVVYTLDATAGSVTTDTWTLTFVSTSATGTAAAGAGTDATKAQIKNSGGTIRVTDLSVGTAAADIILDNPNIAESQTVNITGAATVVHA